MSGNFVSEEELNAIKGLMRYLNEHVADRIGIDVSLYDTNGERLGTIMVSEGAYVLVLP